MITIQIYFIQLAVPQSNVVVGVRKINLKLKLRLTYSSIKLSLLQKQIIQQNQFLQQKKQQKIIQQEESNKMKEMLTQIPDHYSHKITGINSRLQNIKLNLKKQFYPYKKNSITPIYKDSNQLQISIALELLLDNQEKNRVNIDYKDRFLPMPLFKYEKYQKLGTIDPWISDLYEKQSEEAFYGYLHKDMTKEQMKVFYSQNLLFNTVKMMRFLTQKNKDTSIKQILKKLRELSDSALEFQLKKYPQKKKIFMRPQIQNMVQACQIHEDPQYDILRNMKFRYQYEENGIYYKQIKLMINKIIKLTNQHFKQYQKQMKKYLLFNGKIFRLINKRRVLSKKIQRRNGK